MLSIYCSDGELRHLSACQAQAARALHQLVKDTRLVIEETERLLESPLWAELELVAWEQPQPIRPRRP